MAKRRRVGDRGQIAFVIAKAGLCTNTEEMAARADALLAIDRFDADEDRPLGRDEGRPLFHEAPDIVLFLGHHAAEPEIARGGLAVDLGTGDMALLDAHDAERFGAVRRDAARLTRIHDRAPGGVAVTRRNGQLVGKLAGKRDAEEPCLDAVADRDLGAGEKREGLVANIEAGVDDAAQGGARPRPGDGILRPLLADRDHLHVEVRAEPLMDEFEMLHHAGGIRGRGGHDEMRVGDSRHRPVVHDETVFA